MRGVAMPSAAAAFVAAWTSSFGTNGLSTSSLQKLGWVQRARPKSIGTRSAKAMCQVGTHAGMKTRANDRGFNALYPRSCGSDAIGIAAETLAGSLC
jgi:hypothetical protein